MNQPRYVCYYDASWMGFVLVDRHKLKEDRGAMEPLPDGSYKRLTPEEVQAVVLEATNHKFLEQAVRDDFDKEVTRRHMDMIDKLIER